MSGLLHAERRRLGTRTGTRSLGCYRQAIMVLRWLLDGTRIAQLAADNTISRSTGYTYLHEGLTVIADQAPGLNSALLAAKMAGYSHVTIDGTLIETDRCRTPGPTAGVDLWWSGKHDNHGGNVQVIARCLGIDISSAVAWQRAAAGDWHPYAARAARRMSGSLTP